MTKVSASTSSSGVYDPNATDPDKVRAWEEAKNEARDAGIIWERPQYDNRSAQDIINDSPLLKNLGNQSNVRDMLEDRVGGDIDTDADAAFRAEQVLEHVERFDENGSRIVGGHVDNGRIDGFTNSGEAYHGTEAGRLQDFGKYGFSNLEGKLQNVASAAEDPQARKQAEELGIRWERPDGDNRSAQDIIDGDPLLKNLGNQSQIKDMLKERVGDFEKDADAAYRAAQVLEHVERLDEKGQKIVGHDVGNGSIDGFTSSDEARHGSEAGRLQDFGKYGFSSLKGKLTNPDSVGDDQNARKEAEKAGITWELPDNDKRSAQDIINDNPLLKNLGNQSGVRDMLKERVGDFEKDADAAFRASQVLDRIVTYDEKGNLRSGDGVSNSSIDGFTSSDEARHDTEAGRLQDFGKYGFSTLPGVKGAEDLDSYKDFLAKNKDADETSKALAKYASLIDENYDAIKGKTGEGDLLTAQDLKKYKNENPQISEEFKEALDFWSQPGAFKTLETSKDPLKYQPDGNVSKDDITSWLSKGAPTDAPSAIMFLSDVANGNLVSNADTSKLDWLSKALPKDALSAITSLAGAASNNLIGNVNASKLNKDLFEHPENHSVQEKAAALQDLLTAQKLILKGGEAGFWKDDYSKVSIANRSGTHPDPKEVLKDLNAHIDILQSDPELVKYLNDNSTKQLTKLLDENKGLKDAVQATYDSEIASGKALDKLWDEKTKDGKTDQQGALGEFFGSAKLFQDALHMEKPGDIQDIVKASKHNDDFQAFYEKSLVTGDRFNELLKDNSFDEAISEFTTEVSLYNSVLDPKFTDKFDTKLNDNFTKIVQENAFEDATFDDLKTAFGVNGGDELDENKVKALIDQTAKDNPAFFINEDGTVAKPDQILANFRSSWDVLRQGTKTLSELAPTLLDPGAKAASDKGLLHGVSGLILAGVTIAKEVQNGGKPTDKQLVDITIGSVQTATVLTEGGIKNYKDYFKNLPKNLDPRLKVSADQAIKNMTDVLGRFENAAKGVGGIAGIVGGAYSIFDGVQSIRKGDKVNGGITIASGALGLLSGIASGVEGGLGVFAPTVLKALPIAGTAGVLGLAAAGFGTLALLLPSLIEEGKFEKRADDFGDLLGSYLKKYEIDGVPNGDFDDIPEDAWPDSDSGIAS